MTTTEKKMHFARMRLVHLATEKYLLDLRIDAALNKKNSEPKPGQTVWPKGVTAYPK